MPPTFIENVFAQPKDVLTGKPTARCACFYSSSGRERWKADGRLEAALLDGEQLIAARTAKIAGWRDGCSGRPMAHTVMLDKLGAIELWDLKTPKLYYAWKCGCCRDGRLLDEDTRRIGFREAQFTPRASS